MSRIGKMPIVIPNGVKVTLSKNLVVVEGQKGKLSQVILDGINIEQKENKLILARAVESLQTKSLHGLYKVIINNMVTGVTQGFKRSLEIVGTGHKATVEGKKLTLNIGYSHACIYDIPEGIKITVDANVKILVEGIDKQVVGQVAADIRKFRPPEPYKGKGIKYTDEVIRRKAGKSSKK